MDRETYEQLDRIEENQEEIKETLELIKVNLGVKEKTEEDLGGLDGTDGTSNKLRY